MTFPPQRTKFLWLISAALLPLAALRLFAQDPPLFDITKTPTLYFPADSSMVVDKASFEKALAAHCQSFGGAKTHDIDYDSERIKGGVTAVKPGTSDKDKSGGNEPLASRPAQRTGNHVSQYVSFASMKELEMFLLETQMPAPCK